MEQPKEQEMSFARAILMQGFVFTMLHIQRLQKEDRRRVVPLRAERPALRIVKED